MSKRCSSHGPPEERFWKRVSKPDDPDKCWQWTGGKSSLGYGDMMIEGKRIGAHRFSYQLHHGPIPEGMWICHHCDNPKCINPDHLFIGTHQDNSNDKIKKGRDVQGFAGKKHTEESRRKIGKANSKNQKGKGNSQYGTCWIYNEETQTNKKIPRFEFSSWKKHGWVRGRRMKSP